jgi:hypothetical protein
MGKLFPETGTLGFQRLVEAENDRFLGKYDLVLAGQSLEKKRASESPNPLDNGSMFRSEIFRFPRSTCAK